jgi:hypothetical protein
MDIPVTLKYLPKRERNGTWLNACRGYLVEQGLKRVEIVLVDQHYLEGFIGKISGES